ncbi:hypothetical protein BOX15_Mlig018714g2 [Macrostomum lignano]|uniref:Uncharacterized protein n=1 Tax=Macrostomum lignano TaxID=282301 RepID=A0A267GW99_9PLAT|nr:hypothetical protein BOX15_Mlig018714g2 [Macrostomum lignano]
MCQIRHLLVKLLSLLSLIVTSFSSSISSSSTSCQATDTDAWSEWSVWTQECTGRLADQFPSDADSLRDRASAVSQFSTRQRPCRCLAVKQQQQQTDCPQTVVQLRWRHPPPALQHYLAVNCAWCNWDSWQGDCDGVLADGCSQTRQRDCLCRPDNRSLYSTASARRCSLGWAIDATIERRFVGNFSSSRRRYSLPGSPGGSRDSSGRNGGSGDDWIFGDLGSAFPDVFKAVFVLVALVIALISCRGLCILVQNRFGDSGSLDSIYRPGPGEATDDAESRPFADGDEEASGAECSTVLDIDAYTASGELTPAVVQLRNSANLDSKRSESSSRGSYPDPFTSSHPLSVVYEPVDEAAEAELDSDEAVAGIKSDAEPSTVPKYSQPVSFVESALVVASRDSAGAEAAGSSSDQLS